MFLSGGLAVPELETRGGRKAIRVNYPRGSQ